MSATSPHQKVRRAQMEQWCTAASKIDLEMQTRGAPALSPRGLYRLAFRLRRIKSVTLIGHVLENAPSAEAISAEIDGLRNAVYRLALFGKNRPEKGAIDVLGGAVSDWRAERQRTEFEYLFERPIKVSEDYTEWGGTAFVREWFAGAKVISAVLRHISELESQLSFNWPRQITELQGHTLPELFALTYPSLKFGGREPVGRGFDFVRLTMAALDYDPPANETIRSARKKMRNHSG